MRELWSVAIPDNDFWYPFHKCIPIVWNNTLYYAYQYRNCIRKENDPDLYYTIAIQKIDLSTIESKVKEFVVKVTDGKTNELSGWGFGGPEPVYADKELVHNTRNWKFYTQENGLFLNIGAYDLYANKESISIFGYNAEFVALDYWDSSEVKNEFHFGNLIVKYNQRSTLECYDTISAKVLWRLKIKGYLYTKITEKDNFIYFGTAGKGGAFYFVDLRSGEVLTEFDNGNASEFAWYENSVLISNNKGILVRLNPYNGEVLEFNNSKTKVASLFYVFKNKLFHRTYSKSDNTFQLVCVEL